jgi:hypothetical protein
MQRIKDAGIEERALPGHTTLHKPVEFRISLFTATWCSNEKNTSNPHSFSVRTTQSTLRLKVIFFIMKKITCRLGVRDEIRQFLFIYRRWELLQATDCREPWILLYFVHIQGPHQ